ncbi:hypothetical protein KFE98_13570 [bacterium SCSIO 12741]|nr:hypothetical protein KFE98_13570 [bacterium SCSIO 12741]
MLRSFVAVLIGLGLFGCQSNSPNLDPYEQVIQMPDSLYRNWLSAQLDAEMIWETPNQKQASKAYLEDLAILRRSLDEAQTGMYRFCTPAQIDSLFLKARKDLQDSASYLEFFNAVAPVFALMGNSHSGVGHSKAYKAFRKEQLKFIPLKFVVSNERLYVRSNLSADTLIQPGFEVLEINGQSFSELANQMKESITSDGKNQSLKWQIIQDYFPHAYSNFIGQPEVFDILCQNSQGEKMTLKLPAMPKPYLDSVAKLQPGIDRPFVSFNYDWIDSLNTSILTIGSFNKKVLTYTGVRFEEQLRSTFSIIKNKGHQKLILDLRDNSGGWTGYGRYLVSYLVNQPIDYIDAVYVKKKEDFAFEALIQNPAGIEDTMNFVAQSGGLLRWENYPNQKISEVAENHFEGQLVVLTNGSTMSCAGVVSALLKENTQALFIGEESGVAAQGTDGITLSMRLPHSQLGVTLSLGMYVLATQSESPDRGVFPDVFIQARPEELFLGNDPVLEFALTELK